MKMNASTTTFKKRFHVKTGMITTNSLFKMQTNKMTYCHIVETCISMILWAVLLNDIVYLFSKRTCRIRSTKQDLASFWVFIMSSYIIVINKNKQKLESLSKCQQCSYSKSSCQNIERCGYHILLDALSITDVSTTRTHTKTPFQDIVTFIF